MLESNIFYHIAIIISALTLCFLSVIIIKKLNMGIKISQDIYIELKRLNSKSSLGVNKDHAAQADNQTEPTIKRDITKLRP